MAEVALAAQGCRCPLGHACIGEGSASPRSAIALGDVIYPLVGEATLRDLHQPLPARADPAVAGARAAVQQHRAPADFELRRSEHYVALSKALDPSEFIEQVRGELRSELEARDRVLPELPFLEIADRGKRGAIKLIAPSAPMWTAAALCLAAALVAFAGLAPARTRTRPSVAPA